MGETQYIVHADSPVHNTFGMQTSECIWQTDSLALSLTCVTAADLTLSPSSYYIELRLDIRQQSGNAKMATRETT